MMDLEHNNFLPGDNIRLRLIEESDAKFVVDHRTNERLRHYISRTSPNIDEQKTGYMNTKRKKQTKKNFISFLRLPIKNRGEQFVYTN